MTTLLTAGVAITAFWSAYGLPVPADRLYVDNKVLAAQIQSDTKIDRVQNQIVDTKLLLNSMRRDALYSEQSSLEVQGRNNPSPDALPFIRDRKRQVDQTIMEVDREREDLIRQRRP